MAFRYLSWILFPLLGCYAVYSLLYLEHKGWYSWVLSMLYGFLLTFGERACAALGARFRQVLGRRSSGPRSTRGPVSGADSSPDRDSPGWAGVAHRQPGRDGWSGLGVGEGFLETVNGLLSPHPQGTHAVNKQSGNSQPAAGAGRGGGEGCTSVRGQGACPRR